MDENGLLFLSVKLGLYLRLKNFCNTKAYLEGDLVLEDEPDDRSRYRVGVSRVLVDNIVGAYYGTGDLEMVASSLELPIRFVRQVCASMGVLKGQKEKIKNE